MSDTPPPVYRLVQGDRPLVVSVPHAGRYMPSALRRGLVDPASPLPDTDHFVDHLYAFAEALGASVLVAGWSRWVIDLNRPADDTPLYPGQAGTGLVPRTHFDGRPIWAPEAEPDAAEVARRRDLAWRPYHAALRAELDRVRSRWGHVVLWDAHSIRSRVPRLFEGQLPDLSLGTYGGRSCAPGLRQRVADRLAEAPGWSHVVDGRFQGGYITRHYGAPADGVHALQLELAQCTYLDEARLPARWDAGRAAPLQAWLASLLDTVAAWHP